MFQSNLQGMINARSF